jgi:hypothetical protein
VTLRVYDLLGQEVMTLVDGYQAPGVYARVFDASRLSSGVYFYRLQSAGSMSTRKMVVAR